MNESYVGYLKYTGALVDDGVLDARKSAEALIGFDEIVRYFIAAEEPSLVTLDFEIPVRIRHGSWEALIPDVVDKLFTAEGVIGTGLLTYATVTATKAANDGFLETGGARDLKKAFKSAIKSAQWVIKVASHVGGIGKKDLNAVPKNNNEKEIIIQVPNGMDILDVPQKYYDLYTQCPDNLFSKVAGVVQNERILEIGIYDNEIEDKVIITEREKSIFYTKSEPDNDTLFPELIHGQHVTLEGAVTRVNEKQNTIGFEYSGHILTSKPRNGSIAEFKQHLLSEEDNHFFPKIKISGVIDRTDEKGHIKEKRPQIIFDIIEPIIQEKPPSLF